MPKPLLAVLQNSLGLEKEGDKWWHSNKYEGSKKGGNGYTCGDIGEVTARHGKRKKNLLPFCLKKSCSGHHVALCTGSTALSGLQGQNILTVVCVVSCVSVECLQQTLLQEMTSKATTSSDNYILPLHIALLLFEERI